LDDRLPRLLFRLGVSRLALPIDITAKGIVGHYDREILYGKLPDGLGPQVLIGNHPGLLYGGREESSAPPVAARYTARWRLSAFSTSELRCPFPIMAFRPSFNKAGA